MTIGNDPYVTLASQIPGSINLDELSVAGGWMGEAIEMVSCETIDANGPHGKDFPEVADAPGAESFVIPGWTDRQRI